MNWGDILNFQYQLFVVWANCDEIHPIVFRRVFQTRHKLHNFASHSTPDNHRMEATHILGKYLWQYSQQTDYTYMQKSWRKKWDICMCLLNLGHGSKGDIVQLDICDILVDVQWDERDIGMLDAFKWPHLLTFVNTLIKVSSFNLMKTEMKNLQILLKSKIVAIHINNFSPHWFLSA